MTTMSLTEPTYQQHHTVIKGIRLVVLMMVSVCSFLLSPAQVTSGADTTFKLLKTIKGDIVDITTDGLGNLYLISSNQQVKKLNDNYDSVGLFNDVRRNGKLFSVDASNPLKVLLYYRDFATVVILDRFLMVRNTIDLRQSGIYQSRAISQSFDNNIWVFDDLENKIKKVDDGGTVLMETTDFRVLFDAPPKPQLIEDHERYLFAYDSTQGLSIFDYYGTLKNQVALKGLKDLQGFSKGIIARDDSSMVYYQPATIQTNHIRLPQLVATALKVRVSGDRLFALLPDGVVHVYRLP